MSDRVQLALSVALQVTKTVMEKTGSEVFDFCMPIVCCRKHPLLLGPMQKKKNIGAFISSLCLKFSLLLFLRSQLTSREKAAIHYNQKLKEKFQYHPQVKRIARHRHLPRDIFKQKRELQAMKEARRRK